MHTSKTAARGVPVKKIDIDEWETLTGTNGKTSG